MLLFFVESNDGLPPLARAIHGTGPFCAGLEPQLALPRCSQQKLLLLPLSVISVLLVISSTLLLLLLLLLQLGSTEGTILQDLHGQAAGTHSSDASTLAGAVFSGGSDAPSSAQDDVMHPPSWP